MEIKFTRNKELQKKGIKSYCQAVTDGANILFRYPKTLVILREV